MGKHIFLTRRTQPLPAWRTAFPGAAILPYPALGGKPGSNPQPATVWLHLAGSKPEPALLVQEAMLAAPGSHIVVLSNVPNDEEGLSVLEAGAVGYTSALAVPEMLLQVAVVVENGGLWVGPNLMQRLLTTLAGRTARVNSSQLDKLSQREKEVALAVASGASNKEIARQLSIAERTVKAHLSAVFESLGVRDRLQLSLLINGLPDVVRPLPDTIH